MTKSDLVTRDIEVLRRISEHNQLFVNLTITTLDTKLARILEPRAPRPDLRLRAVKELNLAGMQGRRELRAGDAGYHGFARRAGRDREGDGRSRRQGISSATRCS